MNVMFPKCYTPHAVAVPSESVSIRRIGEPRYIDIPVKDKIFRIDLDELDALNKFRKQYGF